MISPPTAETFGLSGMTPSTSLLCVSKFISIFTHKDFILHLRRILVLLFIRPTLIPIPSWLCQILFIISFYATIQSLTSFSPQTYLKFPILFKKKKKRFSFFFFPSFTSSNYCFLFLPAKNSWQRTLISIGLLLKTDSIQPDEILLGHHADENIRNAIERGSSRFSFLDLNAGSLALIQIHLFTVSPIFLFPPFLKGI